MWNIGSSVRIPSSARLILAFGFAAAFILWDETRKFLVRRFPKGPLAKIAW